MTTERPLPMSVKSACDRAFLYARETPRTPEDHEDVVLAAHALALVIQRAKALESSGTGADEFLAAFDNGDFDNYSFHRGVEFALRRVKEILETGQVQR